MLQDNKNEDEENKPKKDDNIVTSKSSVNGQMESASSLYFRLNKEMIQMDILDNITAELVKANGKDDRSCRLEGKQFNVQTRIYLKLLGYKEAHIISRDGPVNHISY